MDNKIKLQTKICYELTESELKRMFLSLSLFNYRYERVPEYDERKLLKLISRDFKEYLHITALLAESDPNSLIKNRLHTFMSKCHAFLKHLER